MQHPGPWRVVVVGGGHAGVEAGGGHEAVDLGGEAGGRGRAPRTVDARDDEVALLLERGESRDAPQPSWLCFDKRLPRRGYVERVVRQHDDASAHGEGVDRRGQRTPQDLELGIDLDPQGLEGPLGRIAAGAAGRCRDAGADQLHQACARLEGGLAPFPDHRVGDATCKPLFAVLAQNAGEFPGRVRVEHIGGGASGQIGRAHV